MGIGDRRVLLVEGGDRHWLLMFILYTKPFITEFQIIDRQCLIPFH